MISLKRNSKGEFVKATGLRSRASSIYKPNQKEDFKISRGRFSNFLSCRRCFYLDRVRGLTEPSTPGWALNTLTDTLLKKEFDECRLQQKPHRILIKNNLSHIIPFQHDNIDKWRNSLSGGLQVRFKDSNIILQGGVDDIWLNTKTDEIIIVDYKSQQSNYVVSQETYFKSPYREGYKTQLDFYAYLLKGLGFNVSKDSYLYICNAIEKDDGFFGKMHFDEVLIHYEVKTDYIDDHVQSMINTMNSDILPESNESCENCAYAHMRSDSENGLST